MKRINSVIAIVLLMALAAGCSNVRNSKAEMTSGSDTAIGKTTAAETTAAATTTSETTVDTTIVFSMDAKDETETTQTQRRRDGHKRNVRIGAYADHCFRREDPGSRRQCG